ncbi:MAG: EF-hand domain-containing protein [Cyanobacteria bacterium J06635_10]
MLTELQTRKWTRLFDVYDTDGSGIVERRDFEIIFQNLAQVCNLKANSPEYNQLHTKFIEDWEHLRKDTDKDNDGKVQLEEWLEHCDRRIQDPSMYRTVVDIASQVFDLFDLDGNGVITVKEYKKVLSGWRVPEEIAEETFPKIDFNGDSLISKDEFVELLRQFHTSDDPEAPGNLFFGPY